MLRQSRSTNTLSRHAPLPSMLIAISFLSSTLEHRTGNPTPGVLGWCDL
jgi:hypothetical protein